VALHERTWRTCAQVDKDGGDRSGKVVTHLDCLGGCLERVHGDDLLESVEGDEDEGRLELRRRLAFPDVVDEEPVE